MHRSEPKRQIKLLTRERFRNKAFERDKNKCVTCGKPAVDVHHIIDRKLFNDGGYYLDNGVSLCGMCHYYAENSTYSTEHLRRRAKITNVILPGGFDPSKKYDKWGKIYECDSGADDETSTSSTRGQNESVSIFAKRAGTINPPCTGNNTKDTKKAN